MRTRWTADDLTALAKKRLGEKQPVATCQPWKIVAPEEPTLELKQHCFIVYCDTYGIKKPTTEYKFHPTRKFRFDYCWVEQKIALEVDGGVFTQGRHTRGSGYLKDMEKFNLAAIAGFRVVKTTPQKLCSLETVEMLRQLGL